MILTLTLIDSISFLVQILIDSVSNFIINTNKRAMSRHIKDKRMATFEELPEECIAIILSRTTPVDAGRLSLVCKTFHSAANFDDVWNRFLLFSAPQFMASIISHNPLLTKKAIYLALSDRGSPIIINHGKIGFYLDRKSGKKCCILAAKSLSFDRYRRFIVTTIHDSRFALNFFISFIQL